MIDELVVDGDADGAAGTVAGKGVNGGVVRAADDAEYEGAVDMEAALVVDGRAEGGKGEGAEGGVVDAADAGETGGAADSRER